MCMCTLHIFQNISCEPIGYNMSHRSAVNASWSLTKVAMILMFTIQERIYIHTYNNRTIVYRYKNTKETSITNDHLQWFQIY